MDFVIRELSEEDVLNGSFLSALSSLREAKNLDKNRAIEIFNDCRQKGIVIYVAVSASLVLATVRLIIEKKFYHDGASVAHIEDVATHPDYFGKGIAKALINKAIEKAREENCYKVILDCSDDLIVFYEKFGFKKGANCLRLDL